MLSIKIDTGELFNMAILLQRAVVNTKYERNVFFAGGSIRDTILGERPSDYDLLVARPNEPLELAQHLHSIGLSTKPQQFKRRGVVAVHIGHMPLEIAQVSTQDQSGKLECEVDRIHYLQNDALRRDFTINSLYCGIDDLEVLDPTGMGRQDLDIRIIRSVTDPCLCFKDDPLRMFRAIRLAICLNAQIEDNTWGAILNKASSIKLVARERVKEELTKILTNDKWTDGFILLKKSGLLHYVSPIMDDCITDLGVNTLSKRFKMASSHKSLELDSMKLKVTLLAAYLIEMTIRQAKNSMSQDQTLQAIYQDILCCFNVKQKDLGTEFQLDTFELINAAICLKDDILILEALLKSTNIMNQEKNSKRLFATRLEQLHRCFKKLSNHKLPVTGTDLISFFPGIPKKTIGCIKNIALMLWLSSEQISKTDLINRLRDVTDDCMFKCSACTCYESNDLTSNSWEQSNERIQRLISNHTNPCFNKEHRI